MPSVLPVKQLVSQYKNLSRTNGHKKMIANRWFEINLQTQMKMV